jgi:hypothetical protein
MVKTSSGLMAILESYAEAVRRTETSVRSAEPAPEPGPRATPRAPARTGVRRFPPPASGFFGSGM